MGIEVRRGNPRENIPGKRIVIPTSFDQLSYEEYDLTELKKRYIENTFERFKVKALSDFELRFLAEETKEDEVFVSRIAREKGVVCT